MIEIGKRCVWVQIVWIGFFLFCVGYSIYDGLDVIRVLFFVGLIVYALIYFHTPKKFYKNSNGDIIAGKLLLSVEKISNVSSNESKSRGLGLGYGRLCITCSNINHTYYFVKDSEFVKNNILHAIRIHNKNMKEAD